MNAPFVAAGWIDDHLLFWLVVIAVVAIPAYFAIQWGDKAMIRGNLHLQGARRLFVKRFRRLQGWLTYARERFYRIRYRDRNGWEHEAIGRIPASGGIYYADDRVIGEQSAAVVPTEATPRPAKEAGPLEPAEKIRKLEAENERLQAELRALKGKKTLS